MRSPNRPEPTLPSAPTHIAPDAHRHAVNPDRDCHPSLRRDPRHPRRPESQRPYGQPGPHRRAHCAARVVQSPRCHPRPPTSLPMRTAMRSTRTGTAIPACAVIRTHPHRPRGTTPARSTRPTPSSPLRSPSRPEPAPTRVAPDLQSPYGQPGPRLPSQPAP
jgi:hypothetical protein